MTAGRLPQQAKPNSMADFSQRAAQQGEKWPAFPQTAVEKETHYRICVKPGRGNGGITRALLKPLHKDECVITLEDDNSHGRSDVVVAACRMYGDREDLAKTRPLMPQFVCLTGPKYHDWF